MYNELIVIGAETLTWIYIGLVNIIGHNKLIIKNLNELSLIAGVEGR